jgi:glucose/arabinose dehydrogenase
VVNDLPAGSGHLNRALAIDAQGRIFVSSGSSCNVCRESDPRKATILRYEADGTKGMIYASGLRNASGLAFDDHGQLWAVVNQRDNLVPNHTDLPPDEFNRIQQGGNYGWPFAYPVGSRRVPNPEFPDADVSAFLPTTLNLQAHSAPLQLAFDERTQTFFIAYHGSWNRSPATGYKVVTVQVVDGKPQPPQDFATGWLTPQGEVLGRPVGVALGHDGSLFISDDRGYIFRVFKTAR